MNSLLELTNICKSYGNKRVLNDLNLIVNYKDFITIKGESGSGKSTLLNVLGFMDVFDSGKYIFNSKDVISNDYPNMRNKEIGFVFQNFNLINGFSVIENIKTPYLYSKKIIDNYDEWITFLLSFLHIENLINMNVENLSGGEKQRVSICRALSLKPRLILADEPTGNLDPTNKKVIVDIFKEINKLGITILVVTHDDAFDEVSNRHFLIDGGKVHEEIWKN